MASGYPKLLSQTTLCSWHNSYPAPWELLQLCRRCDVQTWAGDSEWRWKKGRVSVQRHGGKVGALKEAAWN